MLDTHRASDVLMRELSLQTRRPRNEAQRAAAREAFLRELEPLLPLAGITRVADISWLSPSGIHVFQTTRPDTHSHPFFGQNSGSQGKGRDATSARLSAILETIEVFSAEPRNVSLVRGSYTFLRNCRALVPPERFSRSRAASRDAPLTWTPALSLEKQCDVLVPAEAVFFPFFPADYATPSCFPCNSTGLAAGRSLVEASIHGVYEVIERHFRASFELDDPDLTLERLETASLSELPIFRALREQHPELVPCVLSLRSTRARSPLSMVISILADQQGGAFSGFACNARPLAALEASLLEALQSAVTIWSGAREDTTIRELASGNTQVSAQSPDFPEESTSLEEFLEAPEPEFDTLQEELSYITAWVHAAGFPDVLIKDLTRSGLGVPVVRVLVPGMGHPRATAHDGFAYGQADVVACRFATDL